MRLALVIFGVIETLTKPLLFAFPFLRKTYLSSSIPDSELGTLAILGNELRLLGAISLATLIGGFLSASVVMYPIVWIRQRRGDYRGIDWGFVQPFWILAFASILFATPFTGLKLEMRQLSHFGMTSWLMVFGGAEAYLIFAFYLSIWIFGKNPLAKDNEDNLRIVVTKGAEDAAVKWILCIFAGGAVAMTLFCMHHFGETFPMSLGLSAVFFSTLGATIALVWNKYVVTQ